MTFNFVSHLLSNDLKASELHCAIDNNGTKSLILVCYLHGMHIHTCTMILQSSVHNVVMKKISMG